MPSSFVQKAPALKPGGGTASISGASQSSYTTARVLSVDGTKVWVVDQSGQRKLMSTTRVFGKGIAPPAVDETWLITQMFGEWTFAVCINPEYEDLITAQELATILAGYMPENSTTVSDWNLATTQGFYYGPGNTPNAPTTAAYNGLTLSGNTAGLLVQAVWRASSNTALPEQWQRMNSGSAWGSWYQVYGQNNDITKPVNITDWNTATTPGFYTSQSGAYVNGPKGTAGTYSGFVVVDGNNDGAVTQMVYRLTSAGTAPEAWIRQRGSAAGNPWGAWAQIGGPPTWTNLTLNSGYIPNASFGYTPAYSLSNYNEVTLRGNVAKSAGSITAGGAVIMTLPSALWPAEQCEFGCANSNQSGGVTGRVEISVSGVVTYFINTGTPTWFSLDGISYYTS